MGSTFLEPSYYDEVGVLIIANFANFYEAEKFEWDDAKTIFPLVMYLSIFIFKIDFKA